MRITVGSILLLLSFSASTRVLAQPVEQKPPPERLTIAWAVDYALRTHPGIAQLEAKRASTDAERRLASVLGSPTLMYAREGIDSGVFSEERLTIAETLNSPLAARLAKRGVRLDVDAIDLDLVAERRAVARRVKIAYLDYVVATLLTSYREESVRLAEQLLQATERREAAGEAAVVDVLRAQVELSNVRLSLVDAERRGAGARTGFLAAAGISPDVRDTPIVVEDLTDLMARSPEIGTTLPIDTLPVVAAEDARSGASDARRREATARMIPDLVVDVFSQNFGDGFGPYGFQLGVRLPFLGPGAWGQRKKAAAAYLESTARVDLARVGAQARVDSTLDALTASRDALALYEADVTDRVQRLVDLAARGYELGEVSLTQVLDARRSALQSREARVQILADYASQLIYWEELSGRELLFTGE